ncbi:hypothetical protein ACS0TY_020977 [Phlomoides rotata]
MTPFASLGQLKNRDVEGAENGLQFIIVRPFNWIGPMVDFIPGIDGLSEGVQRVLPCFSNENPARANCLIFNVGNPNNEVTVRQLAETMTEVYTNVCGEPVLETPAIDISSKEHYEMLAVHLSVYFLEQVSGTKFFVVYVSTKITNSFVQEVPVEGNDLQCTFRSNGYGSAMTNASALHQEPDTVVHRAWRMVKDFHGDRSRCKQPRSGRGCRIQWTTPPPGTFKLNSDAAVYNDGTTGYGFVVRDDVGAALCAGAKREVAGGSSTLVEARALLYGLETAAACGQRVSFVESDSELLIRAINGDFEGEIYVMAVVVCIRKLASCMGVLSFREISRFANKLAHNLAHFCKQGSANLVLLEKVPPSYNFFLREDVGLLPGLGVE